MKRTTVYLDEADKQKLAAVAAERGVSEAELIRQGIRMVTAAGDRPRPRVGYGASRDGRTARETDQLLDETGFGR
jgi:hypothetical protein